ncbi:MAG TPA: matrixin family metalloprotease [Anaeromyxobacter sp.]
MPVARRPRRAAIATLLASGIAAQGCGMFRTQKDVQRDYAKTLQPAPMPEAAAPPATVRELSVRIYADDDYRADLIRWRARIDAQLERANRVIEAQLAVRLVPRSIEAWPHSGRAKKLSESLSDLVEAQPGADADWVIGFVSSSEVFSGSHEQLGMAQAFGRYFVLRGMVSFEEGDAFRRALDKLPDAERDALLHERELHRETAVLLHEWGHTLGAFHERAPDTLMSSMYGRSSSAFSATAVRVIALGLARRTSTAPADRAAWASEYRAEVERSRAAAWDEEEVKKALEAARWLEATGGHPATGAIARDTRRKPAPAAPAGDASNPRAADAAALTQAELSDRMGDPVRAWKLVEPIAAHLRDRGPLQQYACHLRRRADPRAAATTECRGAKALGPRAAAILFSRVLVELGDRAGAAKAAIRAEESFTSAAPPPPPAEWSELAGVLARLDACSAAERAASRAGAKGAPGVVSYCTRTRQRAALLTRDAGVEPAREPEYVEAVLRGRAHAEKGRLAPARSIAETLESSFPAAPGGPLLRCLVEAQGGDPAAARRACAAADRGPPWPYEPPYVLGVLAGWDGRWPDARDQLRRALERDDHDRDVWARLAHAHEKLGEKDDLEKLAVRYRTRFGSALRAKW